MADPSNIDYEEEKKYPWNFRVYRPFEFLDIASMVVLACLNQELNLSLLSRMMPIESRNIQDGAYNSIRFFDKDTNEVIIRGTFGGTWVEAITMIITMDGRKYTVRVMKQKIHTTGLDNELSVHQLVLSIIDSIKGLYQALNYACTGKRANEIMAFWGSTTGTEVLSIEEIDARLTEMGLLYQNDDDVELDEEQENIRLLIHLLRCHYMEKNHLNTSTEKILQPDEPSPDNIEDYDTEELTPNKQTNGTVYEITWPQWFNYFCEEVCNNGTLIPSFLPQQEEEQTLVPSVQPDQVEQTLVPSVLPQQEEQTLVPPIPPVSTEPNTIETGKSLVVRYATLAVSYYYKGNIYYSFNVPFLIDPSKLMTVYNQVRPDFILEYNLQLSTSIRFDVEYNLDPEIANYVVKRNNRKRITICFTINGVATFTGPCQSLMAKFYKIVMDFLYMNRNKIEDFTPIQYKWKDSVVDPETIYRRYYFYQRHKVQELLVDPDELDKCDCEDGHLPDKLPRFPLIEFVTQWDK